MKKDRGVASHEACDITVNVQRRQLVSLCSVLWHGMREHTRARICMRVASRGLCLSGLVALSHCLFMMFITSLVFPALVDPGGVGGVRAVMGSEAGKQ